jgi:hypothetical protein
MGRVLRPTWGFAAFTLRKSLSRRTNSDSPSPKRQSMKTWRVQLIWCTSSLYHKQMQRCGERSGVITAWLCVRGLARVMYNDGCRKHSYPTSRNDEGLRTQAVVISGVYLIAIHCGTVSNKMSKSSYGYMGHFTFLSTNEVDIVFGICRAISVF